MGIILEMDIAWGRDRTSRYLGISFMVKNYRLWGKPPYKVVVVHGGPGAPGSVAPVARELSATVGMLEPLQTKDTVEGEIEELADALRQQAELPVVLIGHSWGAWLAYLVAARYPALVNKLILVGSGPFEAKYAESITTERLRRLSEKDRIEVFRLIGIINGDTAGDKDKAMGRYGELCAQADKYDALPPEKEPEPLAVSEEINREVWAQARELRISGKLLEMGKQIECPVVAIHGDHDPHVAEGVREPLSRELTNFRFILLEKCGHEPWRERYARDEFFRVLREEIT
jgi:pimeloyl-ACP methyl ester carboxylesterase